MSTYKKRIVIDASILRSAGGEESENPTSKNCRDLLQTILKICHRATLGPLLKEEWDKHQSNFSSQWRTAMQSRGKIIRVQGTEKRGLRERVRAVYTDSPKKQADAEKDFHLVEAAIDTDWIVISRDNKIRAIFAQACPQDDKLPEVIWVHPDEENILEWLEKGALPEDSRKLGNYMSQDE